ncbi:endonuclease/exonuclease/phosphatase family protein [Aliivibrio sp. S4TY2]|uniref:endonuclease/exonuclease/phosphatase family protein n=1 Tax=unclassified Aliivibrio TaxID=2645654 RepID=UPI002378C40E|nr:MULTISPECIES: endonuclease/exonuclease/phosphatase family protein [unclassified Aliivibrio]MDD9156716.1 endonuclease/exonuclease/phosphatase family protein [Aliivibrio sp. S4TY2]MDD9160202.1 endonuclease/exonuclease/phosphatase family protein [Aliivibrio sp. S4TY1]MDD9164506.1 endonuclease/exonuclease/phosphatase family protein [Aliivibrio sp. S4MY2]MDD9168625.1 endonuclease/exonuclease/phosphatase family protein [Aliivibrio sp. S4MY4]MDD9184840.1 endonuclease/exonuclease/phosphatase family
MFNKLMPITLLAFAPGYTYAEQLIDKEVITPDIRVGSINIMASRMGSTDNLVLAIKKMDADVIALQEVDKLTNRSGVNFSSVGEKPIDQAKYIADKLGMQSYFCGAIEHDGGKYGSAVISKYPIKLVKKADLPNAEGGEQRTACAVEIDIPDYPAPLMIVATHLDHSSPELRLKQVDFLQTQFSSWQFAHALPIIIGDLNFGPTSEEYKNITAWFNDTDIDLQLTAPSWNPDRKIDYILTSNAQQWDIKSVSIPKPTDKVGKTIYARTTDHLPMVVEMNLIKQ